jgi:predicted nucleic acid-binding protein
LADCLLDADVVIWHLRGRPSVVDLVLSLAREHRIGLSAVTRAEVLQGMRDSEAEVTLAFLDACQTLPVDARVADRAGSLVREKRRQGVTIHLPDALLAATALVEGLPLYTCNVKHFPFSGLDLRAVQA